MQTVRILMLTKFLPIPADSGGKQRSSAVLRRLAKLGTVTICAFNDGTADLAAFDDLGVEVYTAPRPNKIDGLIGTLHSGSVSAGRFRSKAFVEEIHKVVRKDVPDCLVVSYGQLAPYARLIPARHRILDLHNIESALFSSYAKDARGFKSLVVKLESSALRRIERRTLASFNTVTVVSDRDLDRISGMHPHVLVCPNGWDPSDPVPMGTGSTVVFVGLFGWAPNADAAVWLVEKVWPLVRREQRDARLFLVGREPTPAVRALEADDVIVTGTVADVRPYLANATVAVAPLRAGGGSRLKILEALNTGRPVVATTIGAEGLEDFVGKGLLLADTPQDFADTVIEILNDPDKAGVLGELGNLAVSETHSWDQTLAPLLDDIVNARL